ncbi:MAG: sensor histidine kinase [Anaerolineales bacterium]|nr:sensor histidine kinase [Anaerolineales bacterium]
MSKPSSHAAAADALPLGVDLVFILVALAGYVPSLLAPELRTWPWWRIGLFIGLGALYLAMGLRGWDWLVEEKRPFGPFIYFTVQIAIITLILWLSLDLPNATWILMMPIVGQSAGFPRLGTVLVVLTLLASFLIPLFLAGASWTTMTNALIGVGTAMLFVLIFTFVTLRESDAREEIERLAGELQAANQQLRHYAVQAEELATTKERNRLAREIHDSLGHYLTVVNVQLGAAQALLTADPDRARDALQKSQQLTQDGLAEVRRSVAALRESPVDSRPLDDLIAELVTENRASGIVTEFALLGASRSLPPQTRLTLFRAVQEGLTNARKHARASRVDVTLDYRQPRQVRLAVADNGAGSADPSGGFGLLGLKERASLLGGELTVETAVGSGFTLRLHLPG